MFRPLRSIALVSFLLLAGLAQGQPRPNGDKPAPNPGDPAAPVTTDPDDTKPGTVRRDPTTPNVDMRKALGVGKTPSGAPAATVAPKLALITLRARVISQNQPPIAYIEVDKQQYAIGPDSKLVIGGNTLQVLEISATQVRIKVEPLNEVIVLR